MPAYVAAVSLWTMLFHDQLLVYPALPQRNHHVTCVNCLLINYYPPPSSLSPSLSLLFRRIFPALAFQITKLNPGASYTIHLRLENMDRKKYKYEPETKTWTTFGRAEEHDEEKMTIEHVDGTCTGAYWMKQPVSFKTAKMTNNPRSPKLGKYVRTCFYQTCAIFSLSV